MNRMDGAGIVLKVHCKPWSSEFPWLDWALESSLNVYLLSSCSRSSSVTVSRVLASFQAVERETGDAPLGIRLRADSVLAMSIGWKK